MMQRHLGKILFLFLLVFYSCKNDVTTPKSGSDGIFIIHDTIEPYTWHTDSVPSSFRSFVDQVRAQQDSVYKQIMIDSFVTVAKKNGIPIVEDSILVHFLYYDSIHSGAEVKISGDFNNWNMNLLAFTKIEKTNLYYFSRILEPDARIEYKLQVNGIWQRDPLNPNVFGDGGFNTNSEISMPMYEDPPEILSYDIPHGSVTSLTFHDPAIDRDRAVWVYLPPGYDNSIAYPTAFFHDGSTWLLSVPASAVFDYLIDQGFMCPVIGVFVQPRSRDYEYLYNQDFAEMFVNELVPWIGEQYNMSTLASDRAIIGFSHGGMAALFFALRHPEVFGKCAAYSPTLHVGDMVERYSDQPRLPVKIYLDAGTYEYWLYEPSFQLAEILMSKGYDGHFYSWHEYHTLGSWSAHLDNALTYFWPVE